MTERRMVKTRKQNCVLRKKIVEREVVSLRLYTVSMFISCPMIQNGASFSSSQFSSDL